MSEAFQLDLSPAEAENEAARRAEAFLLRFSRLDEGISRKLQFRDQLAALCVRAAGSSADLRRGPGAGDSAAEQLALLEREINREIDHLVNLKREILSVLDQIENPGIARILCDIYLSGRTVEETAKRSHYTLRYTYKLRRRGLAEVDRILREARPMCGYVSPVKTP